MIDDGEDRHDDWKPFDAKRMKRQIRDEIGKQIRDMMFEQEQGTSGSASMRILKAVSSAPGAMHSKTEKSTY